MQGPVCSHTSAGGQKAHPSDQGVHPKGASQRARPALHAKQAQQSKPGFPSGTTGTQQAVHVHKPPKGPALPLHHAQRTPRHAPRGKAIAQANQQGSQSQAAGPDHHMQQPVKAGQAQDFCEAADHSSTARVAALQHQRPFAVQPFQADRVPTEASTSQTAAEGAAQGCHVNVHQHQQKEAGESDCGFQLT